MLVENKKKFGLGAIFTVTFAIVLMIMFLPWFGNGRNAFRAADRLFNAIAKGSAYYIPGVMKGGESFIGHPIRVAVPMENPEMREKAVRLFTGAGASIHVEGSRILVSGDLGRILIAVLKDSDAIFQNRGEGVARAYGISEKEVLFVWYNGLLGLGKDLTRQKKFYESKMVHTVITRAIEPAYNFHKIDPLTASSSAGILSFSLGFYVIYTLWWGFAILLLFEGLGLQMKAGRKKEV